MVFAAYLIVFVIFICFQKKFLINFRMLENWTFNHNHIQYLKRNFYVNLVSDSQQSCWCFIQNSTWITNILVGVLAQAAVTNSHRLGGLHNKH